MKWAIRQLVPTLFRSRYTDSEGDRHFCVWWMWLGRCFGVDDVVVAG